MYDKFSGLNISQFNFTSFPFSFGDSNSASLFTFILLNKAPSDTLSSLGKIDSQSVDHSNDKQAMSPMQNSLKEKQEYNQCSLEVLSNSPQEVYKNLRNVLLASGFTERRTILQEIEAAEKLGGCVIDFQI